MLKLRILLLRNTIYYLAIIIALLYFIYTSFFIVNKSKYNDITTIDATITNIITKDYGFIIHFKTDEKFIGYYYLDNAKKSTFYNSYSIGDKVSLIVEEKPTTNNTLKNTFNYKRYLYNKKIYKVFEIKSIKLLQKNKNIIYHIKNFLYKRSRKLKKSYPYINTLLFGNKNDLDDEVLTSFRDNGISHLFAISGTHISIFVLIISKILQLFKVKENKRYLILIIFLLFFMFLTNYSMSVVRACIFTIFLFINKIYYFYIKPENLLILTLAIIVFINPLSLYDIGLLYSFFISFSLIVMKDYINRSKTYLGKLLSVSFVSFIVSFPITIYNFYQINFLSIIYNLFFVPYVSFIILPLVIISFIFPFFDSVLYLFVLIMEKISLFLKDINIFKVILCKPNLSIMVLYCVSICMMFYGLKKHKKLYLIPFAFVIIINYIGVLKTDDNILFIDVGQGDSILLTVNDTYNLIDTGGVVMTNDSKYTYKVVKNKTIPYLKSLGIRHINNLIITHGDADHMKEAYYLVENFKVKNVIFNRGNYNKLELELITLLKKKNINYQKSPNYLVVDKYKLYFLNTGFYDNENDNSNVIYFNYNGTKMLFMGDAGVNKEQDIINKYNLNNIDILKVGHHGSNTSSSNEFIDVVNPKISIISVGKDNKYGHPKETVLDILNKSKIYRTDQDGSIEIKLKNNGYKVTTYPP